MSLDDTFLDNFDFVDALLADLENSAFPLARSPVLLTSDPPLTSDSSSSAPDSVQIRPPPPAYTPQQVCCYLKNRLTYLEFSI